MTESTLDTQIHQGELIAGKYRVDRVIGQGGMGFVVVATHEQLEQRVAIKFLLPAVATRPELVQRFLREARAAVKIQSEHVARVFDVGQHGILPYMVMEYLEGADLGDVLASHGALDVTKAVSYVLDACDAVAEAHALGIVHRDLKPANLFLANRASGKPIVKVLDFGISKAPVDDKDRNITNATAIMGSPSYMSPEQMVASASVDARADIWSLGVVLYELLSRQLPFVADTMPELVGVILQSPYPPLSEAVPVELRAIVARCLEKSREARYATVAELARALLPFAPRRYEAIVERIETVLGAAPASERVTAPRSTSVAERTLSPISSDPSRPRRPVWLAAIAVGAVAIAAIGILVVRRDHASTTAIVTAPTTTSTATSPTTTSTTTATPTITADPPPLPSASVATETASTLPHTHVHASAHASASAAPATSASASGRCKTVGYFDGEGNRRFRMECPP